MKNTTLIIIIVIWITGVAKAQEPKPGTSDTGVFIKSAKDTLIIGADTIVCKPDTMILKPIYCFDEQYRKNDLYLSISTSTILTASYFITENREPLSEADISGLRPEDIPSFERDVIFNESETADQLSDIFLATSFAMPLAVAAIIPRDPVDKLNALYMVTETALLTNSLNIFSKVVFERKRPFVYNPNISSSRKLSRNALTSLYSGHTANSAALSYLSAKIITDYYPDKRAVKYITWPVAAAIPAAVGYWRVQAGKHFISDVVIGYVAGAAAGILIPWIHHYDRYRGLEQRFEDKAGVDINMAPYYDPVNDRMGLGLTMKF